MARKFSSAKETSRASARAARTPTNDRATETPNEKRVKIDYGPLDRYLGFYLPPTI